MRSFTSHWYFGLIAGCALFVLGPAQMNSTARITNNINPSHAPMVRLYGPDGLPLYGPNHESTSGNWSGYALTSGGYTSASLTWTVPTVTYTSYPSNPSFESTSTWVGIGGDTNSDQTLIQLGTEQKVTSNGTTTYDAWYELIPATETLLGAQYPVSPGDQMSASLACTANCSANNSNTQWQLSMTDSTKGWSWTGNFTYKSGLGSVEWIHEAPTFNGSIVALAQFTPITFTNATVNGGNPNLSLSADGIILNDKAGGNATPCAAVNGNQFIVDYGTTCSAPFQNLTDTHDFNGDGKSDIAWRNSNGDVAIWLMNGTNILSAPDVANVPTSWSIVGQRQLNNSGYADLIWRNTDGDVAIWLMNGSQILSAPDLANVPTSWTIVGTGAYNSNLGYAELFWRNTNGDVAVWEINGTQILAAPDLGNVSTIWTIVGTGDFSGTGNTDILWVDTSGDVAIWFMNGTQVVSSQEVGTVSTGWSIVGTGDFNGDGKTDILWRNANGDVGIWLMNGTQVLAGPDLGNVPASWAVAETGDFNGDGKTDILWRNSNGDVAIWFMNGTQVLSAPDVINVPTNWTIQGANAD